MLYFFLEKLFNLLIHGKWSLEEGAFDASRIRRILVVRNDNVGDVLCSTPAIRSLRRAFPQAYLAALVARYSQDAISGNPDVDEVFIYEKSKHRPDRNRFLSLYKQFQVLRGLKKKRFDLAIGMRSAFSWSEAWLVYFTGARFRLGYAPVKKIDSWYGFFYNLTAGPHPPAMHEVKRVLHLLETIGVSPWAERLIVTIPDEEKKEVADFLKMNGINSERLIGFYLSCRRPFTRWSAEKWATLAVGLIRDQRFVVLTWGPGDQVLAEEVRSRIGPGVFLYPTPTFKHLGALQERCCVFVCPEGGAMHFSTAVGTPTVALFGEEHPWDWGPWGNGHVALRKGNHADLISVDDVYQSMTQWLK